MAVLEALEALFSCKTQRVKDTVGSALLEENGDHAKLKELPLTNLTPDILILHTDEGRKVRDKRNRLVAVCMSPLFTIEGESAHNCACDAVLIRELEDNKCQIYYIELKSDNPKHYPKQFKSASCFFHYVCKILNDLCAVDMKIDKERYVVFHTDTKGHAPSFSKTRTMPKSELANSPESPEKHIVSNKSKVPCTHFIRNS